MEMIIYLLCLVSALLSGYYGTRSRFRIDRLSFRSMINSALYLLGTFTLLMTAWVFGYFPPGVATPFMMLIYSLLAGFFIGYAVRLFTIRNRTGELLYTHRSFWGDHAPNLASIILILFGLYRTGFLTEIPATGIRITSGLSIIAFGFWGWTLRMVPEFRSSGILLLDHWIPWSRMIGWTWSSEEVISIEYLKLSPAENSENETLYHFSTSVPAEERKEVEKLLFSKMEQYKDDREKRLTGSKSR